jgi:hypothetical protein
MGAKVIKVVDVWPQLGKPNTTVVINSGGFRGGHAGRAGVQGVQGVRPPKIPKAYVIQR